MSTLTSTSTARLGGAGAFACQRIFAATARPVTPGPEGTPLPPAPVARCRARKLVTNAG